MESARGHPRRWNWRLPVPLYEAWDRAPTPSGHLCGAGAADLVHLTVPIACPPEKVPMVATVHDVLPLTMPEHVHPSRLSG